RAALGACWNGAAVYGDAATGDIAWGPRWIGTAAGRGAETGRLFLGVMTSYRVCELKSWSSLLCDRARPCARALAAAPFRSRSSERHRKSERDQGICTRPPCRGRTL